MTCLRPESVSFEIDAGSLNEFLSFVDVVCDDISEAGAQSGRT